MNKLLVAAMVLAAASAAPAQGSPSPLTGEYLVGHMPPSFSLGWQTPDGHWREYVRAPETVQDWTTMITLQSVKAGRPIDPDDFATIIARQWTSLPNGSARKLSRFTENDEPVALWEYVIPRDPATGKPETMWLKAIGQPIGVILIQYAIRDKPDMASQDRARAFLAQMLLCQGPNSCVQAPATSGR